MEIRFPFAASIRVKKFVSSLKKLLLSNVHGDRSIIMSRFFSVLFDSSPLSQVVTLLTTPLRKLRHTHSTPET